MLELQMAPTASIRRRAFAGFMRAGLRYARRADLLYWPYIPSLLPILRRQRHPDENPEPCFLLFRTSENDAGASLVQAERTFKIDPEIFSTPKKMEESRVLIAGDRGQGTGNRGSYRRLCRRGNVGRVALPPSWRVAPPTFLSPVWNAREFPFLTDYFSGIFDAPALNFKAGRACFEIE
jgi:hypothetical protein